MDGTPRRTAQDAAARRLRPVFAGATALLVLLLVFFAYSLADSQAQQRSDLEKRFHDRAEVAAAVNQAIFTISEQQSMIDSATRFGGPKVDAAALQARVSLNQQLYGEIVTAEGEVLAATKGAPERSPADQPYFKEALRTGHTRYSNITPGPGGQPVIETATPFKSASGQRVQIGAIQGQFLAAFLNSFLSKLPNVDNAESFVIDQRGLLIASPGKASKPGTKLADAELSAAVATRRQGKYGDRYFTSSSMSPTPWRIVLSAAQSDLYETVSGSKRFVPWFIFGAFVLAAAVGLFLLRRVLIANTQLERAELSRRHALEINDNVVQRLVVAKYALDRGATETSQQKLSETLHETQQLVTSLLEEKEIAPGSLRRATPAETEAPPEPPGRAGL